MPDSAARVAHVCLLCRQRHKRRTCAKLCRKNGGDLEQIKFLLGHASIQTTERYLGSEQEIAVAVNDNLGL
jgi:integrase